MGRYKRWNRLQKMDYAEPEKHLCTLQEKNQNILSGLLLTRGKRQLLAQKSTREIQTGEQVTASSPLLLETGCI